MNEVDRLYREMLLKDARKSKCPRLMCALVKAFWWVSIPEVWTALVVLGVILMVAVVLGVAVTILSTAWITWM